MNKYVAVSSVIFIFSQIIACLYIVFMNIGCEDGYLSLPVTKRIGFHIRSVFFWVGQMFILGIACFDRNGTWKMRMLFAFSVIFLLATMFDVGFLLEGGAVNLVTSLSVMAFGLIWMVVSFLLISVVITKWDRYLFDFSIR